MLRLASQAVGTKETAVGAENKVKLPRDFVQDINCYLLLMDAAALLFAVLSIELGWNGTGWASTRRTELLKALVSVVSVASVVVVLVRYRYQLRCKVERPPTMLMLALEVTVHLLHVPPSLTDRFEVGVAEHACESARRVHEGVEGVILGERDDLHRPHVLCHIVEVDADGQWLRGGAREG